MSAVLDDFQMIDPEVIAPMASNPRKDFDEKEMAELVASVRVHGVIQPLIVRKSLFGFDIVAGERRWTAAKACDLNAVPCMVKELSDLEVAEIQLIENIDRHQLSPMEESAGVSRLIELGMEPETVCEKLGRASEWVQLRLDLPKLPPAAQDALRSGRLGLGAARRVLALDKVDRDEACGRLLDVEGDLNEREVADMIRSRYIEPKQRREQWEKLLPDIKRRFSPRAAAVADVEDSGNYVMAWGAGVGVYVDVQDEVGGLSARPVESVVSWSDLVDAHGIETVLVCAGSVVALDHVVEVVDKRMVIDAERALREQGKAHTLGPRKSVAPEEPEETFEELAVRCVADAILRDPENEVLVAILSPVLAASEIQTAADDFLSNERSSPPHRRKS